MTIEFCACGKQGARILGRGRVIHFNEVICNDCLLRDGKTLTEAAIIRYLSSHPGGHTLRDIARSTNNHHRHVFRALQQLVANGRVRAEGSSDIESTGAPTLSALYLLLPYANRNG